MCIGIPHEMVDGNDMLAVYDVARRFIDRARSGEGAGLIEPEVVDLRSLQPLDRDAVLASAAKTNRVLLLHEATLTGGIAGELAAISAEHAFEHLDAPVVRIASADTPVPYSPPLEAAFLPSVDRVVQGARKLVAY